MENCIYCNKTGERHHIIFRSQGGMDIPMNYVYLCEEHHRGKHGPHKNNKEDVRLKLQLQQKLIDLLKKEYYNMKELRRIFSLNISQMKKLSKEIKTERGLYSRFDIIKYFMGGKFYSEYMLDDIYDESWNCHEDDYFRLVL